jgi:hypothetical protein
MPDVATVSARALMGRRACTGSLVTPFQLIQVTLAGLRMPAHDQRQLR